ncbi:MAG: hypothetical protein K0S09_2452 [Sphingobacteriaceae bacterium]|jgi:hypothetical protein|nr:hypothetical protein [Sphingobacteriaceae bacterium]
MNDVFLIAEDPENECRDIIFHRGGSLRMRVYCLSDENFVANPNELQFYADNSGELLAFETYNFDIDDPGLVIEAIRWYAKYIKNPEMEILPEDPRTDINHSTAHE